MQKDSRIVSRQLRDVNERLKNKISVQRAAGWVARCILSCRDLGQLTAAEQLVENFKNTYPKRSDSHNYLIGVLSGQKFQLFSNADQDETETKEPY